MTENDRALIRVSAALASHDEEALVEIFCEARQVADSQQIEEAILQSYLFLGFPVALAGMAVWRRQTESHFKQSTPLDCEGWAARGHDVCRAVYAGKYDKLREHVRTLHPDLELWIVVEGYGKVLGRPGLTLVTRELCIVASLAVLGASKQLYSHMRGALNVGARSSDVDVALAEAEVFGDVKDCLEVRNMWEKVKTRNET